VAPLAISFALALVPAARADDAAALYDPAAVARIDLMLTPEAIAALTADPSTYVPATFEMQLGDETFAARPAGLKLKGHGTFRPLGKKAAFKLKFAKKDRFLGLKKLTLNNLSRTHRGSTRRSATRSCALRACRPRAPAWRT
jgi:hypothetical protein